VSATNGATNGLSKGSRPSRIGSAETVPRAAFGLVAVWGFRLRRGLAADILKRIMAVSNFQCWGLLALTRVGY